MAKALLVVLSNPVSADREDEYNKWYDAVHLPEVLTVPGIVAGSRYRAGATQIVPLVGELAKYKYLAIYELDRDPTEVIKGLIAASQSGQIGDSELLSKDPGPMTLFYETP